MPFGLTSTGLTRKTLADILAEIEADQRATISPTINQSATSVVGQLNAIFARQLDEVWQLGEAVYNGQYPDSATGAALTALTVLTGTTRRDASKSQLTAVAVNVNAGFSAAAGTMVAHVAGDATRRFVNKATIANAGGAPATVTGDFEAETAGPVVALAGTLTVIAEPLTGWNTVTNPTDAVVGSDIETDTALRLRREQELQTEGSTTVDAIRSDLLNNIDTLTSVLVLENDTDVTDVNGLPPHSIEVIARGPDAPSAGDNQTLVDQILDAKAGGIRAYGASTLTATDSQGNVHTIGFTRPTVKTVYLAFDITINTDPERGEVYPADGNTLVKEAVVAVGDSAYTPGSDVILRRLEAAVFSVPGVVDITATRAGFTASPVGTVNLAVALREVADLDSGRVTVNTTEAA